MGNFKNNIQKLGVTLRKTPIHKLLYKQVLLWAEKRDFGLLKAPDEIEKYHNLHEGQRAFIMGNGPSLNKCNLSLLKNEITFGVNAIFLNQERMDFFPTYYVFIDTIFAEDRKKEIEDYRAPLKFARYALKYCIKDTDNVVWMNLKYKRDKSSDYAPFSLDCSKAVWGTGTVIYTCLQLAFYMGFSEIYLVGIDHNWQLKPDMLLPNVRRILAESEDVNHFHPEYHDKNCRWYYPNLIVMEKSYRTAKQVFENNGRKIYNATVGGNLEIFDRVNYDDLF